MSQRLSASLLYQVGVSPCITIKTATTFVPAIAAAEFAAAFLDALPIDLLVACLALAVVKARVALLSRDSEQDGWAGEGLAKDALAAFLAVSVVAYAIVKVAVARLAGDRRRVDLHSKRETRCIAERNHCVQVVQAYQKERRQRDRCFYAFK